MTVIAQKLSEDEVDQLAAYLQRSARAEVSAAH